MQQYAVEYLGALAKAKQQGVCALRRYGFEQQDLPTLARTLGEALSPVDPEHEAGGMDATTTLFIEARFDRVVRWRESLALWRAIGRPRRVTLPCGHYSAAVFVPWIRWLARRWFDRHLL